MNNEELQSQVIQWMRFPLSVAIVYAHNVIPASLQIDLWQTDYSNLNSLEVINIIRAFLTEEFIRLAVPCFFIFSGFLFYNKVKEWSRQIYFAKIKKRIKTLVIPYLLWNIIAVIGAALVYLIWGGNLTLFINNIQEHGILKIFWDFHDYGFVHYNVLDHPISYYFPYNPPLWYIRDLIMMVFLSPIIYYFLKYAKLYGVIILGILFFTEIGINKPGFSSDAFFFFSFGAYFSIHGKNLIVEIKKMKTIWLFFSIIFLIFSLFHKLIFFKLFIIFGSITLINLAPYILKWDRISALNKFISSLSNTSFFIFVAHTVILLSISSKIMDFIFQSDMLFFQYLKYFMAPIVCVGFCVGLYYIANKIAPKMMIVLTGDR